MVRPTFKKGRLALWESEYASSWRHQFVCYENFDADEVWSWCLDNIGVEIKWVVSMNGVIFCNEDDAVLFALTWC